MINMGNARRNNLFFIELILSIFFFILCAAVCTQLFVSAHLQNEKTEDTNQAILLSQNAAELFLGNQGNMETLKKSFSDFDVSAKYVDASAKNTLLLLYNKETASFVQDSSEATYCVLLEQHATHTMSYADIFILKINDLEYALADKQLRKDLAIRQLSVKKYLGNIQK